MYDENNPQCRECLCPFCALWNSDDCPDGDGICDCCDGDAHINDCMYYEEA